ncbi:hypothetical protein [Cellulomonas soli]
MAGTLGVSVDDPGGRADAWGLPRAATGLGVPQEAAGLAVAGAGDDDVLVDDEAADVLELDDEPVDEVELEDDAVEVFVPRESVR